ncbi:GFA family protein [Pseudomonas cichorii]|uniref:GFA family protein n=1 Tax=Pseudomonas cichorii TaxID=36746 RepID=UPI001C8A6540|nr:GFA family protein [Pseudomonas cichorii]MBX8496229.1 GFA family protein [Pseudomonas cichorii]MBX8516364.1 GFA family protein [Pseudomonas cichorii]MBX8528949.1 GFA family protein [Pseudomonas cichorii]
MQTEAKSGKLEGSCHCGSVRLTLAHQPAHATQCNCSLCLRLGALWAYYEAGTVKFEGHPQNTQAYVWGRETLRTIRCKNCGCATHWEEIQPEASARIGVNINNFSQELISSTPVRHFDGADTWAYVDEG